MIGVQLDLSDLEIWLIDTVLTKQNQTNRLIIYLNHDLDVDTNDEA